MKKRGAYSLVEMLTVIAIFSILGTIVTGFIVKSLRDHRRAEAQATLHSSLNIAVDRFSRVARSSTMIIEANQTTFRVRGYPTAADSVPSEIKFYIENQTLKYSVIEPSGTPPNYTYNPNDAVVRNLVAKVTNNNSTPLFRYYDDTNTLLTFPVILADIKAVEFSPSAIDEGNVLTNPITVSTTLTLRNFKTNL